MYKHTPFTPQEMIGYRDQVVASLRKQLDLLNTLQSEGLFNKEEGILNNNNLDDKTALIEGEIQKLENFEVLLAVVGTMKAGKSTTINAIVGREILPNRNRPMTSLPTLIYHSAKHKEPLLTFDNPAVNEFVGNLQNILNKNPTWLTNPALSTEEMQNLIQEIQAGWAFKTTYQGENEIFDFLSKLNDLVRLSETLRYHYPEYQGAVTFPFKACRNRNQLPKIEVAYRHLMDTPENQGQLVLLDTPGPNEAGQEHLRPMLHEQLERSSAVLLVLDYTQLKSEACDGIRTQLAQIPTIKTERLFALVNKFDQKTANSDDAEATKDIICNDFLKNRIKRENIYPLAAHPAFLANRMATELDKHGKPDWDKEKWISDFAKHAFGETDSEEWQEQSAEDIYKKINRIIKNSHVQLPLENAIAQTQLQAPRIAMASAFDKLEDLMNDIHNFCNARLQTAQKVTDNEIAQLKQTLSTLDSHLEELNKLHEELANEFRILQTTEKKDLEKKLAQLQTDFKESIDELLSKKEKERDDKYSDTKETIKLISVIKRKNLDEQRRLKQKLEVLKEGAKQKIRLEDETERDEFLKDMQTIIQSMFDELEQEIKTSVSECQYKIKDKITEIETQANNLCFKLKTEFDKEGFDIKLTQHSLLDTLQYQTPIIQAPNVVKHSEIRRVEQTGVLGELKRIFSFGKFGYEDKEFSYFVVDLTTIQESVLKESDYFLNNVKEQVEQIFAELSQNWAVDYEDNIAVKIGNFITEIKQQIAVNSLSKECKGILLEQLHRLEKRSQEIQEDIASVKQKFDNA